MMAPSDDDIRMLLETYRFCRKFAHAGEVGTNAVTLIAALDELLELRRERVALHHTIAEQEKLIDSTRRTVEVADLGAQVSAGSNGPSKDQASPEGTQDEGKVCAQALPFAMRDRTSGLSPATWRGGPQCG